jgi:hypothetical protein
MAGKWTSQDAARAGVRSFFTGIKEALAVAHGETLSLRRKLANYE